MSPLNEPVLDRIAAVLEKLAAVQRELTAELVELMGCADASTLQHLFGAPKQDGPVSADKAPPAAAAVLPTQPPPPPVQEGPWDERGFLIGGPRSPDRFPRPRLDVGATGWAA